MKAEHRKELETNVLADRMGRLLENIKQKPERGTLFWVICGIVAVVVTFLVVRYYQVGKNENSDAWFAYYIGDKQAIRELYGDKMPAKAFAFDRAWQDLWTAIARFGVDPKGAEQTLRDVSRMDQILEDECEGDPFLVPEAIYGMAVAEETLAIKDRNNLDRAIDYYKELVEKHSKSAYGKLARERLDILEEPDRSTEVREVYQDLQRLIRPDRKN